MLKGMRGTIVGVLAGIAVVFVGDLLVHRAYPLPNEVQADDHSEALLAYINQLPMVVFEWMLAYWLLAAFSGGFAGAMVTHERWERRSMIVGVILLLITMANAVMIPHPLWMLGAAILFYLPLAWLGGKCAMLTKSRS